MSRIEKEEIRELPEKYRPMGAWGYWAWSIIYSFPVVGLIFMIVNSLRSGNIARRNHARSFFCTFFLVVIILGVTILVLYLTGVIDMAMNALNDMLKMN